MSFIDKYLGEQYLRKMKEDHANNTKNFADMLQILKQQQQQPKQESKKGFDSISDVGNPEINIHLEKEDKDKKEEKHCCECSGMVNEDDILVSICPSCSKKGPHVISTDNVTATTVNHPVCFPLGSTMNLVTDGLGIAEINNEIYHGTYTVLLTERLGNDFFGFTFIGINDSGEFFINAVATPIDDANLTITQCKSSHCSCTPTNFTPPPAAQNLLNLANMENLPKSVSIVQRANGEFEKIIK